MILIVADQKHLKFQHACYIANFQPVVQLLFRYNSSMKEPAIQVGNITPGKHLIELHKLMMVSGMEDRNKLVCYYVEVSHWPQFWSLESFN